MPQLQRPTGRPNFPAIHPTAEVGMVSSRRKIALAAAGVTVILIAGYALRWSIGGGAIRIVDPIVRRWAAKEVGKLSDGRYRLDATPIRVVPEQQRIVIDRIGLSTDTAAAESARHPLPVVTLEFFHCAIDGVDLARLAQRKGFSATRAGCDSVRSDILVPPGVAVDSSEGGGFLSLRQKLDLGRGVPFVEIDSVRFPVVRLALRVVSHDAPLTAISLDRLGVRLDRFHYDPDDRSDARRTLLSDNVVVALDSFRSDRAATDRARLDRLRIDLARGTVELNGLDWQPTGGSLVDSLGVAGLSIDSLDVRGVDWRAFLTRGDARVARMHLIGASVSVRDTVSEHGNATPDKALPHDRWTMARTVEAIGRRLRLDTLVAQRLTLTELLGKSETATTVDSLRVYGLRADPAPLGGMRGGTPIGDATVSLTGISRHTPERDLAVARVAIDLGRGSATVRSLRLAPQGSDADWVRRNRRRHDRIAVGLDSARLDGLAVGEWVRLGIYRANTLRIDGLDLDVLSDKRLPPGRPGRHLNPQQWLAQTAPPLAIDSVHIAGKISYRERGKDSPAAGVLRFEQLNVSIAGLRSIAEQGQALALADSVRFVARTRLMGAGLLELNVTMPPFSKEFDMHWWGSLGPMRATALNQFLNGAQGVKFTRGRVRSISFDAVVKNGRARGRVVPRYDSLWVEVPGVARKGFLSGLRRAVAKFAANQFVVREENGVNTGEKVRVGPINHRWRTSETLIKFLWISLRDALMQVVKR